MESSHKGASLNAAAPQSGVTARDILFGAEVIGLCVSTALVLVFAFMWPQLEAWFVARTTFPAVAACPLPGELEQVHIVVTRQHGQLVAECMFVGSRGTYHRSRHGMPMPRP